MAHRRVTAGRSLSALLTAVCKVLPGRPSLSFGDEQIPVLAQLFVREDCSSPSEDLFDIRQEHVGDTDFVRGRMVVRMIHPCVLQVVVLLD